MADAAELPMLYARDETGTLRHVDSVENGLACGCVCPACEQPLVAKNAGHKVIHHFAHRTKSCAWALEHVLSALAEESLTQSRTCAFPALTYHDEEHDKEVVLSPARTLRVTDVQQTRSSGRGAPDLLVTCAAGEQRRTFALVVSLSHRLEEHQAESLMECSSGVVLVDLARDLRAQRRLLGRHYDREEVVCRYQDPAFIADVLADPISSLKAWARNEVAEQRETEIHERIEAAREAERERQAAREAERQARRQAEQEERERQRREEQEERERQRKAAEAQRAEQERIAEERRLERERVLALAISNPYDVRTWEEQASYAAGTLRAHGLLKAFVATDGSVRVLVPLAPGPLREVLDHHTELAGEGTLKVALAAERAHTEGELIVGDESGGTITCTLLGVLRPCIRLIDRLLEAELDLSCSLGGLGGAIIGVDMSSFSFAVKRTEPSGQR